MLGAQPSMNNLPFWSPDSSSGSEDALTNPIKFQETVRLHLYDGFKLNLLNKPQIFMPGISENRNARGAQATGISEGLVNSVALSPLPWPVHAVHFGTSPDISHHLG